MESIRTLSNFSLKAAMSISFVLSFLSLSSRCSLKDETSMLYLDCVSIKVWSLTVHFIKSIDYDETQAFSLHLEQQVFDFFHVPQPQLDLVG